MKSHELVRRINYGEIKDGTRIDGYKNNRKVLTLYWDGKALRYKKDDSYVLCNDLFFKEVEFEIVEEHKGWFKPKKGEGYRFINSYGENDWSNWNNNAEDKYRYNNHNCFRNVEEAQEYLDYKNALKEAEKPFEYNKDNYFISFDMEDNELIVDCFNYVKPQGTIFLGADKEVAQAFIDKWKPQILKHEFGIFE